MFVDLVSPWATAVEHPDRSAQHDFLHQHSILLEQIAHEQGPDSPAELLSRDAHLLRRATRELVVPAAMQRLADIVARAQAAGADIAADVVLVAGTGVGDAVSVTRRPDSPIVAAFVEHVPPGAMGLQVLSANVVRGMALATRWCAGDSASELRRVAPDASRWEAARGVPLREWLYAEGVAAHLAAALDPSLPLHAIVGVSKSALARLRDGERALRLLLDEDLDLPGLGPLLRWLVPGASSAARSLLGHPIPAGAGRYLAFTMTAARVRNAGVANALRASSTLAD